MTSTTFVLKVASATTSVDWVGVVGICAGVTSVVLAVVAIWLSVSFYRMSDSSANGIEAATTRIESATAQLRELFERMYTDVFSMTRDTVSDMRKTLWPSAPDQIAEDRLIQLKEDLTGAIATVSADVGLTRDKLETLQARLAPELDRAISASITLESDAQRNALREDVLALLRFNKELGVGVRAQAIVTALADRYPNQAVIDQLERMHGSGEVLWSSQRLLPTTELVLRAAQSPKDQPGS